MTTPEQIQQEIERTRTSLSTDVERLGEKVSPGAVVSRRVDRVKGGAAGLKDRVMGAAPSAGDVRSATGSARDSVADAASGVAHAASDAPQRAKQQTQGNPLAAGLIAFGVGLIVASAFPATQQEQQLAEQAEDQAKQLTEPAKQKAQEVADHLREPAQQAVEQVKDTATDAAGQTADQAKSAAQDVKDTATPD